MWKTRLFSVVTGLVFAVSVGGVQPSHGQDEVTNLAGNVPQLVQGNNTFALRLYEAIADESESENVFFSPYSVSQALAMVYAGAEGTTAEQMAQILGFDLDEPALHETFNALNADLVARGNSDANDEHGISERRLNIANALWGEQSFPFNSAFIELVDQYYGGGFEATDFIDAPEPAREAINQWVADHTEDRIQNIVPEGVIDEMTRLVLANAIFFKNAWQNNFNANATVDGDFHLLDGSTVTARLMGQTAQFNYAEGDGYQAITLPYQQSGMSMLVILPSTGTFDEFEADFDAEFLNTLTAQLNYERVNLTLPKFEFEDSITLSDILIVLGMSDAFSPELADFTGMIDTNNPAYSEADRLNISAVLHKAFIGVDEEGTEAAAATVVVMALAGSGMPMEQPDPVEMRVDRPFLFAIRDDVTGTILFMGRVTNPVSE